MNELFSSPTAQDLMDPEAVPLRPGKFEKGLVLQFLSGQYCGWPVVDSQGKTLGVVTELRLLQAISYACSLEDLRVEDIMTTPVYVFGDEPVDVVLNVMVQRQVLRMPVVVGERKLIGVISRGQVLRHYLSVSPSSSRLVSSRPWCEVVHDPTDGLTGKKGGKDFASFLTMHRFTFSDSDFRHVSCPSCLQTLQAPRTTSGSLYSEKSEAKENRPCLLVVDDEASVAELLGEALRKWGYDVLMASNGREGLEVVGRWSVDGILLDMRMPTMDGRTMLDELRWMELQMPVLMMSGESDKRALRQLLQEGAQGFFLKPFHLPSLQKACHRVFKKYYVEEHASARGQVA